MKDININHMKLRVLERELNGLQMNYFIGQSDRVAEALNLRVEEIVVVAAGLERLVSLHLKKYLVWTGA